MVSHITRLVIEVAPQVAVARVRVHAVIGRVVLSVVERVELVEAVVALRQDWPLGRWRSEQRAQGYAIVSFTVYVLESCYVTPRWSPISCRLLDQNRCWCKLFYDYAQL